MKFVIPARKGSKGLPLKNRKLFRHTADTIPNDVEVLVVTDDSYIRTEAIHSGFSVLDRPEWVSDDKASTKSVMQYVIDTMKWKDETIVMLYLTYPGRTWKHIEDAVEFYKKHESNSMLCKKKIDWTPFLVLKEESDNRGSQLFYHNMYRRQDYPNCFEISHFICIFNSDQIYKLNNNLYNNDTIYFPIDDVIDVDAEKDLDKYLNENR